MKRTIEECALYGSWLLAFVAFLISFQVLLGYWLEVERWQRWGQTPMMGPNTATALAALSLGIMTALWALRARFGTEFRHPT